MNLHYDGDQIKAMRWVKYVTYMWEMKNSHIEILGGEKSEKKK
jgi:hypothetical protein